ncbi:MAG TPA: hypothetical protein PL048_06200 [Leptospiraceae bacterium]|nr:hypothetical protein [Leptospiraceae bacterium]HMY67690.1 hypothetical protein [Leptospiraceae bacterium]HMZ58346.1 hypothetical protein [Leptospiraceae bacterium]HNF12739.1 hypothetical protein [Leptospiraceae bacterium]HNF24149.1 hypothetical protein [Leptospiraceae bacterium]
MSAPQSSSQEVTDTRYPFLKVKKEKETILMGINPSKQQHEVLKLIKNQNTIQNAAKGLLFSLNGSFQEQLQMDAKTLIGNLNQLVNNNLIAQVLVFEYDTYSKSLNVTPYFITHPTEDKNYTLYMIFEDLIVYSYNSIRSWFEARDIMNSDSYLAEFKWQLNTKPGEEYKGISFVFNPTKRLYEVKNGVVIDQVMLDYIAKEVTRRILDSKIGIEVPGHGLLMLKTQEIQEFFESAEDFINTEMVPPLIEDVNHKFRIESLLFERKSYSVLEKFPRKTSKFSIALVKEIRLIKSQSGRITYPGSLAIESMIRLENIIEDKYSELWRLECERVKKEFKKNITSQSTKWTNLIAFVSHSDSLKFHPDVWRDLVNDPELFCMKWQTAKTTVHVFTGREAGFFKTLVVGMMGLPENDLWKAQALQNIIEKNDKKLRSLLMDKNFSIVYNEMVRKIYNQHIPWYARIIMFLPLSFITEGFFEKARKKIREEQENLNGKNETANAKMNSDLAKEKTDAAVRLKEDFLADSIKNTLDSFYFNQKRIPTLEELKPFYPDQETFLGIVRKKNYRIVTVSTKGNENADVLLYPEDDAWASKKANLLKTLEGIVNEKNPHVSVNYDKLKMERVQKLLELLGK